MVQSILEKHGFYQSKILIVDDTDFGRTLLKKICGDAGFERLKEAEDGKQALDIILDWKPDLVLLDVHMPNMNGMELCAALQTQIDMNDIVIVMQTGDDKEEFKVQAFQAGVTDFINKPLNKSEVTARAVSHLERLHLKRQVNSDHERIMQELEEAQALQHILLPKQEELVHLQSQFAIDISYHYQPASELGGDYIHVQQLDENRLAIILVDICGHGVPAALYAFALNMLFQEEKLSSRTPSEVMERVNKRFHKFVYPGKFATVFLGIIDCEKDLLQYSAAGSPKPLLFSGEGIEEIDTTSYLLGMDKGSEYQTIRKPFKKGDTLFLYSDALVETADEQKAFLKLSDVGINLQNIKDYNSNQMINAVLKQFQQHSSAVLSDDLSLLVCKR